MFIIKENKQIELNIEFKFVGGISLFQKKEIIFVCLCFVFDNISKNFINFFVFVF